MPLCQERGAGGEFCKHLITDSLLDTLAGPIAESISRGHFVRAYHDIPVYLAKARAGTGGSCDGRLVASVLVKAGWSDEETFDFFRQLWSRTLALFDDLSARIALGQIAAELQRRRLLSGDDIAKLVDVESLREASLETE
jgi:hypothetical protein